MSLSLYMTIQTTIESSHTLQILVLNYHSIFTNETFIPTLHNSFHKKMYSIQRDYSIVSVVRVSHPIESFLSPIRCHSLPTYLMLHYAQDKTRNVSKINQELNDHESNVHDRINKHNTLTMRLIKINN